MTRRLLLGFLALWLIPSCATAADAQERAARLLDLRERAVPIRGPVSASDFSDLLPLGEAIGDARIVQLGESSHGAGATFAAKARLVEFLHRELGFDVLVWESGMYDLRTLDDSLRAGADPASSAPLGVFSVWSGMREALPVFEYAAASHAGDRPLMMAGLDLQLSGHRAAERLESDLLRFADGVRRGALGDSAMALVGRVMGDYPPSELDRFLATADSLIALIERRRDDFVIAHGEREVAFVERVVGNLRQEAIREYERGTIDARTPASEAMAIRNRGWNRRDARMADNLLWLARERYPDRKLMVWAHNGHIMNAYYAADWGTLSHGPTAGGMKPMGVHLAERMGDAVYTLAFTAHSGEHGVSMAPRPIAPAPEGSLEALLHELGYEQAFIDFRSLPPDHWLRQPSTMAIRNYMPETMDDWTRVVDGVYYIDRMAPATPIGTP